jgi:transposase
MLKSKLHREAVLGKPSKTVVRSLKRSLTQLKKEMKTLEDKLLVLTGGFDRFTSAAELCSYAGRTPVIRQIGSSVKGCLRISNIGNQKLRNLLFMYRFNACKYNKTCRDLYERKVAKGKSKKLALIAVWNTLLKQAFAIATSGLIYDKEYKSTLVRN